MKQLTEDYVSYEIAKLLKEKEFEQSTINNYAVGDVTVSFYDTFQSRTVNAIYPDGEIIEAFAASKDYLDYKVCGNLISAPTHQMALKWLREVHKIHINLDIHWLYFANQNGWMYVIEKILDNGVDYIDSKGDENDATFFSTYEQAIEVALLYVLKNMI